MGTAHQLITYARIADGMEPVAQAGWAGVGPRWARTLVEQLALL